MGLALLVIPLIHAITISGELRWFVYFPAIILIASIVIGGLLLAFPVGLIRHAIRQAVSPSRPVDDQSLADYAAVLHRAAQLAWAGGFVVSVVTAILMLQNMDDPWKIGPVVAIALLPLLYVVTFAELIVRPLRSGMLTRAAKSREDGAVATEPEPPEATPA